MNRCGQELARSRKFFLISAKISHSIGVTGMIFVTTNMFSMSLLCLTCNDNIHIFIY